MARMGNRFADLLCDESDAARDVDRGDQHASANERNADACVAHASGRPVLSATATAVSRREEQGYVGPLPTLVDWERVGGIKPVIRRHGLLVAIRKVHRSLAFVPLGDEILHAMRL